VKYHGGSNFLATSVIDVEASHPKPRLLQATVAATSLNWSSQTVPQRPSW